MKNQSCFRDYNPDQLMLFPNDLKQWLPENDLVYFLIDIVNELDLGLIYREYTHRKGGQPPYHPKMMVSLLLYAYCVGMPSSRKIEQATYHQIPFRVLTANQHPDHDTIANFRQRHLQALANLFVNVLQLCQKAGLVKFGHVSLDGTKVRANASRHKAMSYGRMDTKITELKKQVQQMLEKAEARDQQDDALYGQGNRGNPLPKELQLRKSRLKRIREAKKAIEQEADAKFNAQQEEYKKKLKAREQRDDRRGRPPKAPSAEPDSKRQYNFTDPDSRVMIDGATKSFQQSYNCQAAVDEKAQIIVASGVTQETNDKLQVSPLVKTIKTNCEGKLPKKISADAGYFSEDNCKIIASEKVDGYIATEKTNQQFKAKAPATRGRMPKSATITDRMTRKLQTIKGRLIYEKRKHIVEPVFGQIKEARGFRRFSFRGLKSVTDEWDLICLTHNLMKLYRSGWQPSV
jgi:transposase